MKNRIPQQLNYSLEGNLLVAAPGWVDPLFANSVCLIIHHSHERAVGVFLNRNLSVAPEGIWQHLIGEKPIPTNAAIHFGGPQSGPVVAVHNRPDLAEFVSGEGVYFAAQVEHLKQLASTTDTELRLIVGQADWKAGDLDQQFLDGKWLPLPVDPRIVFEDQSRMWARAMREVGNRLVVSLVSAHGQPSDVLAN